MTYITAAATTQSVTAWHLNEEQIRLSVGANHADLSVKQRRELAHYLTADLVDEQD